MASQEGLFDDNSFEAAIALANGPEALPSPEAGWFESLEKGWLILALFMTLAGGFGLFRQVRYLFGPEFYDVGSMFSSGRQLTC